MRASVWRTRHLIRQSDDPEACAKAIHEVFSCPSGRLKLWDKEKEAYMEPPFTPALSLIENPEMECSGPLWVKGGIPINAIATPDSDAIAYERRNRVTLCRCAASANKPFCDGTHQDIRFQGTMDES